MPNILIVDDSATDRALAGKLLECGQDVNVTYAEHGREALELIAADRPDLIVSDLQMPEMDGLELVTAVREGYPSVPVILMTAQGSEQIAAEALRSVPRATFQRFLSLTTCPRPSRVFSPPPKPTGCTRACFILSTAVTSDFVCETIRNLLPHS